MQKTSTYFELTLNFVQFQTAKEGDSGENVQHVRFERAHFWRIQIQIVQGLTILATLHKLKLLPVRHNVQFWDERVFKQLEGKNFGKMA